MIALLSFPAESEISFAMEDFVEATPVVSANANETRKIKKQSNFVKIFISSMYKDLICLGHFFVKKNTFLHKSRV